MLLGPIFSVELVTSARRARYFVVRALYALVLLIALFLTYYSYSRAMSFQDIGRVANFTAQFFYSFAWVQLIAVLLLAPAMAAGTIATERERRTIEYLFTSPLSSLEIVLGKLAARLLHVFCLVLAGVPVLALAMLMGELRQRSFCSPSLSHSAQR
jgi:ABC-type transport system involved in multi-copper enzyme maturation permease subunit